MKVCKIKKLKNRDEILRNINLKIDINDWKRPEEDSFIIIENGIIIPAYMTIKDDCVETLWVDKEYRRKGYGNFLVKSVSAKYAIVLESSVSFWESLGFRRIGGNIFKKK